MGRVTTLECSLCGTTFDPAVHTGCASCPMGGHCTLACCPNCGYTTIDVQRSASARLVGRLLSAPKRAVRKAPKESILVIRPGETVEVAEFGHGMPADQAALLRTYGIGEGRMVKVVQHRPMTVLEVDQTEVALESDLAAHILVKIPVYPF